MVTSVHERHQPNIVAPRELLRVLLIGQELRVEGLKMLLVAQEDMELLTPIADLEQAIEVLLRLNGARQRIHVVVMDWDEHFFEQNTAVLRVLCSLGLRCLVISSSLRPGDIEPIKAIGARGYCFTSSSRQQLTQIIRKVARGEQWFHTPKQAAERLPDLKVQRTLVFYRDRLQSRAAEIGWNITQTDIDIIYHIYTSAHEKASDIARRIARTPGTIRTDLSARIYFYLHLMSDRKVSSRLIAFQVLLEYGIIEYK